MLSRASVYELLRARHVPLREVTALGIGLEDLGAPLGAAARHAGVSRSRLEAACRAASQPAQESETAG
ncbi:MAG: hypothetical protein KatS3mg062_0863 [Tepidiforma sp.]|nr:MAG: hypothetical protein KatS3mg062_0863 [Tepidiforma sp.]